MAEPDLTSAGSDQVTYLPSAPPAPATPMPTIPQVGPGQLDPRVVWTVGGEAAGDLPGRQAVASVVRHRMDAGAPDAVSVVSEPGQFKAYESLGSAAKRFPVGSSQYTQLESQIAPIITGAQPPTVPYTGFRTHGYTSPGAPWNGSAPIATIGGNDFAVVPYKYGAGSGGSGEPNLADAGKIAGPVPDAQYTPGSPGAGKKPPDAQAAAFGFLAQHGFRNEDAPLGSSTNPAGQLPGQGPPSEPNSWYVTPQGQLRQTGDDTPDYLPAYQKVAALRQQAEAQPLLGRLATAGGQGVFDVAASANKLLGGGMAVGDPIYAAFAQAQGGPSAFDVAQASLQGAQAERNQYDLLHHGDMPMALARFGGQAVPITAAGLATGGALGAAGAPGEFLAGDTGGNMLLQGLSRVTGGALQGGQAAALTSSTNDQPLPQQVGEGAALGGLVGGGAPLLAGAGQRLVYGGPIASGPATDLASLALNKYDIPVAAGQVRGAAGDRAAATAYSELLGRDPAIHANNQVQRQKWMQAVTNTYGDPTGSVVPEALASARQRIGGVMNDVASRSGISSDAADDVQTRISQIIGDAQKVLPDNEVKPLLNTAQSIGDVRGPTGISGESYQALTRQNAPLDRLESSDNSNVAHYASKIRDALDDGVAASSAPEDVAALQNARWQYKNLMTVARAAKNQNNVDIDGVFRPNALNSATSANFANRAFQGAGDLDELNQIRQKLMSEPPNSFTADRAAFRLGPLETSLAGIAEAGGLLFHDPAAGPLVAGGLVANKAIQAIQRAAQTARLGPGATNRLLGGQPALPFKNVAPYVLPSAALGNKLLVSPAQPQSP